jgi:RNA polymerase sigma-70 factor (ECF subfamily)
MLVPDASMSGFHIPKAKHSGTGGHEPVLVRPQPEPSTDAARRARFEQVYNDNYDLILGYAMRRTTDEEAADVVAETFLIAWRRLSDVPSGDSARLWLYGTARRVLANRRRSDRRRMRLAARLRATAETTVEPKLASGGTVAAAFARVPASQRELLALVAWEELDSPEIAAVLGCSTNAARIRLHRARRRFAHELERVGIRTKHRAAGGHEPGETRDPTEEPA